MNSNTSVPRLASSAGRGFHPPSPTLSVSDEKYSAYVEMDPNDSRVHFRGNISTENPATVLNPFVDAVHAQAIAAGRSRVRVDFTSLEFCNSSGFKAFIHWVERIKAAPEHERYKLCFVSARKRRWQIASLMALSCFGPDIVAIETI